MKLSLVNLKFPCLNFYNSTNEFENVEIQIDINHEAQYRKENGQCITHTKISVYPKNPNSIDGQFSVRVEASATFSIEESDVLESELHNKTFQVVFPYMRSSVANLLTIAEFPPFHIPFIDPPSSIE